MVTSVSALNCFVNVMKMEIFVEVNYSKMFLLCSVYSIYVRIHMYFLAVLWWNVYLTWFPNILGIDHGVCDCNKCKCNPGWEGPDCSCRNITTPCVQNNVRKFKVYQGYISEVWGTQKCMFTHDIEGQFQFNILPLGLISVFLYIRRLDVY